MKSNALILGCCVVMPAPSIRLFYSIQMRECFFLRLLVFQTKKLFLKNIATCSHKNLRFGPESDINSV
jgi:hypothetical protein